MGTLGYYYDTANSVAIVLSILIGGIILFSSRYFITWWVGSDFYLGEEINLLLCINFILQSTVLPNRILLATSLFKVRQHNLVRIFEGVVKLTLSIIVVKNYGMSGVLVVSILTSLVFSNIFLNRLANMMLLRIDMKRFFLNFSVLSIWFIYYIPNPMKILFFFFLFFLFFLFERNNWFFLFKRFLTVFRSNRFLN